MVMFMVWVEIWCKGAKGSYMSNRYNEKFSKVIDFIKRNNNDFVDVVCQKRVGSSLETRFRLPQVIISTNSHSFVIDCTEKQLETIKNELGDVNE